jgi:hypothetical protein
MNLDKARKRIAKKIKMGSHGYPEMTIAYHGANSELASEVTIQFVLEEGAETQVETFRSKGDAREDEVIQSSIVKMIERSSVKTLIQIDGVMVLGA